jgi:hypothetical protein
MARQYFIQDGVRRAVATLAAGRSDIPAIIYEDGQPPYATRIPLSSLHSPKYSVSRNPRYINIEYKIKMLGRELDPIAVEPLGVMGQPKSVPVSSVLIV